MAASLDSAANPSLHDCCYGPTQIRHPAPFVRFEKAEIEQSISDRFEDQMRRRPDDLAVVTTRDSITYARLDRLSNQIALSLLANRGAANEPVALLANQGILLIAAILGSLKAGKIYVSLDPSHPLPRNAAILADSTAAIILTDTSNLDRANALAAPDISVLNLDAMEDNLSVETLRLNLTPDRLAYIFYTSGSTGHPKGVTDTHRNVLHNIMRYTNSLRICGGDRLTLLQSPGFSGSVSSLFCALLNGATSCIFSLQQDGPEHLASWVCSERITIYHSVPSIFRLLTPGAHSYPALRIIRLEGDQVSPKDIEIYKRYFPDSCILVNGLGLTECGLVRQYFVDKDTPVPESIVPIGYAVEDMEVFLANESGQAVDIDCVGEIAVRSRYLAPGYWGSPKLTEAVFLVDPEGGDERTYRTGDLGRMRANGCLEYLGRKNLQRKIRGQWVEIPEIEKALRGLAGIKDVVVITRADTPSEPRLVAYLVPAENAPLKLGEIRRYLGERLPAHMAPSSFVTLDALPLNAYGKVDRQALPRPGRLRTGAEEISALSLAPVERFLADIVRDVLGLPEVRIHDNFFDLGGHSLHVMQIASRIRSMYQLELPPNAFFEAPTVEALARLIVRTQAERPK